jgi:hypothetical protein
MRGSKKNGSEVKGSKVLKTSDSSSTSLDSAREHVKHAKRLLNTGKRESVTDDILWVYFKFLLSSFSQAMEELTALFSTICNTLPPI